MASVADQQQFIIDYLTKARFTDVCDAEFHNEFRRRFGGRYSRKSFGAQPVHKAMRRLESMWKEGILDRTIFGMSYADAEPGFPRWVYSYGIAKED